MQVSSGQAEEFNAPAPSDFFQLLNLDLGATTTDIKQSYRALQRLVHPDLIGEWVWATFCHLLRQVGLSLAASHYLGSLSRFAILHAGDDANEVSVLLNIAYTTLMDEALRAAYQYDVWLTHTTLFRIYNHRHGVC